MSDQHLRPRDRLNNWRVLAATSSDVVKENAHTYQSWRVRFRLFRKRYVNVSHAELKLQRRRKASWTELLERMLLGAIYF